MKEISKEEILTAWSETSFPTGVYIHSPFCKEQCTYCTFKGTLFEKNAFHRYYSEYLPNQIKFYEPVLSSDHIRNYFWGGGTPTLMSAEIMRDIFDLIPNFRLVERKLMEFHMADWTKEQLNVVSEYNFNTVVACVQSFDREVVKQQKRRAPKNNEVIYNFLDHANTLGLFTMSDIIFFDTGDVNRDLDRLSSDMQKLADHDISEISVQTIFDEVGKYDVQVTDRVNEFLHLNTQYHKGFEREDSDSDFADATGRKARKEDKIYKKEIDWMEMSSQDVHLDGLWTNPEMIAATNFNVLGIGSYKNHKYTFSRIEDKLEYVEDGDTITPKWLCTYDKKDWPMKKLVAEFYGVLERSLGDPPDGIDFTFATEVVQYDEDDSKKKRVERKLKVFYRWMKGPDDDPLKNVESYADKLKILFEDPTFWNKLYE
jgi:hypothetical protein